MPRAATSQFGSRSRPTRNRLRSSEATGAGSADGVSSGRLDDQLCFALYAAANAMQRAYTPLLRPFGLTYLQYLVLLVLWEDRDASVGEIGRRLFLDSGTLTPVLRRLEQRGVVTRRRSSDDERSVRVALTPAGGALEASMDALRATIAGGLALEPVAVPRLRDELRALRAQLADFEARRDVPSEFD